MGMVLLCATSHLSAEAFSLRRHDNVTAFYQKVSAGCIKLGVQYKVPPAAILAIAGLESGYGSGYVSQVTGNILSLGAKGNDAELPALKLARNLKTRKLLYDFEEISALGEGNYRMEQRPASLKKDYRPAGIAGSKRDLAYLKYNPDHEYAANMQCLEDFMGTWLSKNAHSSVYRAARFYLDEQIKKNGIGVLFEKQINRDFIHMIGGRANSFNYRKTWPPKVITILSKAGLVELCATMKNDRMSFVQAWGHAAPVNRITRKSPRQNKVNQHIVTEKKRRVVVEVRTSEFDQMIKNIAEYNSLPPQLLVSMIEEASAYDKNKIANQRYGLMQISIKQAQDWATANYYTIASATSLLEPTLNIRIGAWSLAQARNYWAPYKTNAYALALCEYSLNRKSMLTYIAYDQVTKKLVIKNTHLFSFVNSVINRYSQLKQK